MHVGQIYKTDCANGTGIRISLFVSGCTIHCKGCFNARTWDFDFGVPYDEKIENFILEELSKDYYEGITILGGEPFEPSNQETLVLLIRRIKKELPQKSIWMFSGYVYDRDLIAGGKKHTDVTDEILDSIDVLVDGPFVLEKKNIALRFRGSENQRIIDMKESRKTGRVELKKF
ncbi:MAG: anaerobic ribonucleoside-triphosphate reductase activating protein [Fibrobacter sp.]|nr:anaerobic ribonucleoside-triphosphate reductase activating protein [Fibrobacter sp.]